MKKILLLLVLVVMSSGLYAKELTGRDVAVKVDNRDDGNTRYSEMTLTLINKNGSKRERQIKSYAKDCGDNMKDTKQIMFFLYPGDVKGTGFLTWEYDKIGKDDDKWLYLPAMKKTRRISGSSSKTDYFMGTDFTYDDMGDRNVDEDTHKLLREETLNGQKCWVLESKPKTSGEIYTRKVSYIRQDALIAMKIEYYDKLNKLHRVLTTSDIKKVNGFWTQGKMLMKNVQTEHQTLLEFKNQKYNISVNDNLFTVSKLEKGL